MSTLLNWDKEIYKLVKMCQTVKLLCFYATCLAMKVILLILYNLDRMYAIKKQGNLMKWQKFLNFYSYRYFITYVQIYIFHWHIPPHYQLRPEILKPRSKYIEKVLAVGKWWQIISSYIHSLSYGTFHYKIYTLFTWPNPTIIPSIYIHRKYFLFSWYFRRVTLISHLSSAIYTPGWSQCSQPPARQEPVVFPAQVISLSYWRDAACLQALQPASIWATRRAVCRCM